MWVDYCWCHSVDHWIYKAIKDVVMVTQPTLFLAADSNGLKQFYKIQILPVDRTLKTRYLFSVWLVTFM